MIIIKLNSHTHTDTDSFTRSINPNSTNGITNGVQYSIPNIYNTAIQPLINALHVLIKSKTRIVNV